MIRVPSNFWTKTIITFQPRCNHNHNHVNPLHHHPSDRIRVQLQNLQAIRYPASAFRHPPPQSTRSLRVCSPCEPTHERTVLFHRLFLTTPSLHFLLNKPPQCQEKRPANGLNAPIFDPRNHSRPPPFFPAPLAVDSSDYLRAGTRTYAAVQATTRPRRYVRTAPNHLVKTCK